MSRINQYHVFLVGRYTKGSIVSISPARKMKFIKENRVKNWINNKDFKTEYSIIMDVIDGDYIKTIEGGTNKAIDDLWLLFCLYLTNSTELEKHRQTIFSLSAFNPREVDTSNNLLVRKEMYICNVFDRCNLELAAKTGIPPSTFFGNREVSKDIRNILDGK